MSEAGRSKRTDKSGGLIGAIRRMLFGEIDVVGETVREYTRDKFVEAIQEGAMDAGEILFGRNLVLDVESSPTRIDAPSKPRPKAKKVVKKKSP